MHKYKKINQIKLNKFLIKMYLLHNKLTYYIIIFFLYKNKKLNIFKLLFGINLLIKKN